MQVTKEIKDKAVALGKKFKTDVLFVNENGEFFTSENLASVSVGGDKQKYAKIELSTTTVIAGDGKTAAELIESIEAAESKEAVEAILNTEKEGKSRKTVLEAAEAKLETFKG